MNPRGVHWCKRVAVVAFLVALIGGRAWNAHRERALAQRLAALPPPTNAAPPAYDTLCATYSGGVSMCSDLNAGYLTMNRNIGIYGTARTTPQ